MNKSKIEKLLTDQQHSKELKVEQTSVSPAIVKPNVAYCVSSYFKLVETENEITMSNSNLAMTLVATLKDESGGVCQIINEDHCYVV